MGFPSGPGCRTLEVGLQVHQCARRQAAAGSQCRQGLFRQAAAERRIDEHDVDAGRRLTPQPGDGLRLKHLDMVGPEFHHTGAQGLRGGARILDQRHAGRASRGRFQTQRTAAGEQVHAAGSAQNGLQPVEQRFTAAVAGRAQAGQIRHGQAPAAPLAGDDANRACFFSLHAGDIRVSCLEACGRNPKTTTILHEIRICMLRIFRKNRKQPGAVQDVQLRPAEQAGDEALEQRLEDTRRQLGQRLSALLSQRRSIDEDLLEEIETTLITADISVKAALEIIENLRAGIRNKVITEPARILPAVQAELFELIEDCEQFLVIDESKKPFVILMVGVNGAGKTTTIGKLAQRFKEDGLSVMLAAGDTFRAAAVEQLKSWGERNDIPVVAQASGADSAAVIFDAHQSARARRIDVLIADTAGRLHTQSNLMEELKKIRRVMGRIDPSAPHETMLVVDAGTGQNALNQAREFNQAVQVTGITVTKLDGTARGGVLFGIAHELGLPIRYIGVGEAARDLRPFDAGSFVNAILPID